MKEPVPQDPAAGPGAAGGRPLPGRHSRRGLLAGGVAGAAALLAGCGDKTLPPSNIPLTKNTPGSSGDVGVLNGLLAIEYRAIYAYTALVPALPQPANVPVPTSGPPPPPNPNEPLKLAVPLAIACARDFLGLEVAHAGELQGIITQAGGTPVKAEASYEIGRPTSKDEIVHFLHELERAQVAAYMDALTKLSPGRLRAAAAAILANEAQQLSVLRMVLGMPPVPSAFVTGRE